MKFTLNNWPYTIHESDKGFAWKSADGEQFGYSPTALLSQQDAITSHKQDIEREREEQGHIQDQHNNSLRRPV